MTSCIGGAETSTSPFPECWQPRLDSRGRGTGRISSGESEQLKRKDLRIQRSEIPQLNS